MTSFIGVDGGASKTAAIVVDEHGAKLGSGLAGGSNHLRVGIEEATRNAREAATKFARDSSSNLGKIRRASQGQFSIDDRDQSTPHIKKVRIVSTIDYYLVD